MRTGMPHYNVIALLLSGVRLGCIYWTAILFAVCLLVIAPGAVTLAILKSRPLSDYVVDFVAPVVGGSLLLSVCIGIFSVLRRPMPLSRLSYQRRVATRLVGFAKALFTIRIIAMVLLTSACYVLLLIYIRSM